MAYNKLILPTPQITTGNWTTVDDSTTSPTAGLAPQSFLGNLGGIYPIFDASGRPAVIQYVKFNPTTNTTAVVTGAPLYYKDNTRTIVTQVIAESATYAASSDSPIDSFAGVYGGAAAPAAVGDAIWILKTGAFDSFADISPGMAVGDRAVLSNAANTLPVINVYTRVAAGTALGTAEAGRVYISCYAAAAAGVFGGWLFAPWN